MPEAAYRTTHARPVRASVDATVAAMRATPLHEARLAYALLLVRSAGAARHVSGSTIGEIATSDEPGLVALGGRSGEIALGWVGQPWTGARGFDGAMPRDAAAFAAFDDPDAVRVGLSLRCDAAPYGTILVTETRIAPGAYAARPFARYWTAVRLGSGLVRGSMLRAIARRAEDAAAGPGAA